MSKKNSNHVSLGERPMEAARIDPLPSETRRGEEDVFWKMVNGDMEHSLKAHEEMAKRAAAEKHRLESIEAQKALMMGEERRESDG